MCRSTQCPCLLKVRSVLRAALKYGTARRSQSGNVNEADSTLECTLRTVVRPGVVKMITGRHTLAHPSAERDGRELIDHYRYRDQAGDQSLPDYNSHRHIQ